MSQHTIELTAFESGALEAAVRAAAADQQAVDVLVDQLTAAHVKRVQSARAREALIRQAFDAHETPVPAAGSWGVLPDFSALFYEEAD